MVGYNFHPMFERQVASLTKRQTIRADRKRHARMCEPVQLYTGMRQRGCRKLVTPDPVCVGVHHVRIELSDLLDEIIASIAVDGVPLSRDEIEAFACAEGFAPELLEAPSGATARQCMGAFWRDRHGFERFEGVLIKWWPA